MKTKNNLKFRTMKRRQLSYLAAFILLIVISFAFCTHKSKDLRTPCDTETGINTVDEFALLTEYLGKHGNIINRNKDLFFIDARDLYKSLKKNVLILDIRKTSDYNAGHIPGAIQIDTKKLFYNFKEKLTPYKYDKIVLVCYSGQSAVYNAAVLQLLGYNNVCALKWGMSSWEKGTAEKKWLKKLHNSSPIIEQIEIAKSDETFKLSVLSTGLNRGFEILEARAIKLLAGGYSNASINLDKITNPTDYHFIQYSPKKIYNAKHPKGVKLYESFNSLICPAELKSLPADKVIVVLSEYGQDGAIITAYLKLLGYKVKNLNYGVQNYMHTKVMQTNGQYFHKGLIMNYPVEKVEMQNAAPVVEEEGGC